MPEIVSGSDRIPGRLLDATPTSRTPWIPSQAKSGGCWQDSLQIQNDSICASAGIALFLPELRANFPIAGNPRGGVGNPTVRPINLLEWGLRRSLAPGLRALYSRQIAGQPPNRLSIRGNRRIPSIQHWRCDPDGRSHLRSTIYRHLRQSESSDRWHLPGRVFLT